MQPPCCSGKSRCPCRSQTRAPIIMPEVRGSGGEVMCPLGSFSNWDLALRTWIRHFKMIESKLHTSDSCTDTFFLATYIGAVHIKNLTMTHEKNMNAVKGMRLIPRCQRRCQRHARQTIHIQPDVITDPIVHRATGCEACSHRPHYSIRAPRRQPVARRVAHARRKQPGPPPSSVRSRPPSASGAP